MMTAETWDTLQARVEYAAQTEPRRYRLKVLLFALLGYGYIVLVAVGILAVTAAALLALYQLGRAVGPLYWPARIGGQLLVVATAGLLWLILRPLWARPARPTGLELERERAPALHSAVDELRRALRKPSIHHILVTPEFNAGVLATPRLGPFGWCRYDLLVGLPLLEALSPEQFRAVLAHELGHVAGADRRFEGWVYRVRASWSQLIELLEQGRPAAALFTRFYGWYAPFFAAYSFVLVRETELAADRAAAQLVGARVAADALLETGLRAELGHARFWEVLYARAEQSPSLPQAPFTDLAAALREPLDEAAGRHWLEAALRATTARDDTHPCLRDRLAALGEPPHIPPYAEIRAADVFLDGCLDTTRRTLDRAWREAMAADWLDLYLTSPASRASGPASAS